MSHQPPDPTNNMASPQGTNINWQGLLSLHPELRNTIYEYVFADIQDNMVIHLEGGANEKHRVKAKGHETEGVPSALDLLLTCKQIYNEAAGIAYSKLSLTLGTVHQKRKVRRALEGYDNARLTVLLNTFAKELRATTRSHITRMYFRDFRAMRDLSEYSSMERYPLTGTDAETDNCTENCLRYATWNQLVHRAFHNIRTITIDLSKNHVSDSRFARLKAGASWLSLVWQPNRVSWLIKAFSNLEEIVVRRENGEQQVSYVRDCMIFAAGSGMPLGGHKDVE